MMDAQIVRPYRIQSRLVSSHSAFPTADYSFCCTMMDAQIVRPYRIQSRLDTRRATVQDSVMASLESEGVPTDVVLLSC